MFHSFFTAGRGSTPKCKSWPLLGISVLSALLSACTSVQLPPWVPGPQQPVVQTSPPPLQAPAEPAVVVQVSPVPPPSVIASLPIEAPAPYSSAVAARFPAPSTVYSTPGLQVNRTTFTTQDEIQTWLRDQAASLARSAGTRAAVLPIGLTQQGRQLEALVLSRSIPTDPDALRATGRPTVLLIGQQHGDEPAASEALLVIARELAQGLLQPLLERINVVIVPRANPDSVSQGQGLAPDAQAMSRDYLLLNAPETQALARLVRDYRPTVVMDLREYPVSDQFLKKFGGVQKFDALMQYSTVANMPEFLTRADEEWYRRPLLAAFKGQDLSSEWHHTISTDIADRTVSMGSPEPVTSRNVGGLKNVVSLSVETRGAGLGRLHIQRRVHTHVTAVTSVLGSTAQRANELNQLYPYLEKEVSGQSCKGQVIVEAANTPAQYDLKILDPASGADKTLTVDWESALALRALKTRVRPCGYWLSSTSKTAIARLRLHGVQILRVVEPSSLLGDIYHEKPRMATAQQAIQTTTEGGLSPAKSEITLVRGVIDAPAGSFYIPLNQPLANLAIAALEPDSQSSYFSNKLLEALSSTARVMSEPALKTEEVL